MPTKRLDKIDRNFKAAKVTNANTLQWLSAADRRFTVRGLPWFKQNKGSFSRLPLRAKTIVREPVWLLAQSPASGRVCFRSDSGTVSVRITNVDAVFMPHMPMSGSNGCILYLGVGSQMRPYATAVPDPSKPTFERPLFSSATRQMREFTIYLPLYKELKTLEIGLDRGAKILPPTPPVLPKPVVFYGTSITQGGCANTAGTDYVSILGRLLNLDVINLGFSGNGKGEPELARLVSEIDASLYVLDYTGNVSPEEWAKTLPEFVRILRKARPTTPILLESNICFSRYGVDPGTRAILDARRDFTFEFYAAERRNGHKNLHLVDGYSLIPFGADAAYVDGVHPTDHGFMMIAERLAPFVSQIILPDP